MSGRDSFVHLHLHTEYSMLDGASRIGEVVAAAAADGQPAVGITDHGNMYGVLPLYEAAREAGIKPVLGMEGYFTNTSRFERPKRSEHEIFHLTMLEIARKLKAPLLATNDSHYTHKEDAESHDALLCVQTGALQSDPKRFKFDGDDFYIKSAAEMRALFAEVPDACDNTLLIAER